VVAQGPVFFGGYGLLVSIPTTPIQWLIHFQSRIEFVLTGSNFFVDLVSGFYTGLSPASLSWLKPDI
jgi:hypothetical protein